MDGILVKYCNDLFKFLFVDPFFSLVLSSLPVRCSFLGGLRHFNKERTYIERGGSATFAGGCVCVRVFRGGSNSKHFNVNLNNG